MMYKDMVKFLNDNGINAIQPIIASEVDAQLEKSVDDKEFEDICHQVYGTYLDCDEEPDMWELVNDELIERGYIE